MAWPYWLLLSAAALAAALLLALHLLRFRYAFDYAFPNAAEGRMVFSFLWYRKEIPIGGEDEDEHAGEGAEPSGPREGGEAAAGRPRPGQEGFLSMPASFREGIRKKAARFKARFKAAGLKWILDLAAWGHLLRYALGAGWRTLRFAGPSLERLHVGAEDILLLGRFASAWSAVSGMAPFLACPVEYGFNEKPFALRLRVSGGCTALGLLSFALALLVTFPWLRLGGRFVQCWRNPRLNRVQRKLAAVLA